MDFSCAGQHEVKGKTGTGLQKWPSYTGGSLLWIELFSQKGCAEVLSPLPAKATLFGNKDFIDVIKVR